MDRRKFLVSTAMVGAIAGCTGDADGDDDAGHTEPAQTDTEMPEETQTPESTPENTPTSTPDEPTETEAVDSDPGQEIEAEGSESSANEQQIHQMMMQTLHDNNVPVEEIGINPEGECAVLYWSTYEDVADFEGYMGEIVGTYGGAVSHGYERPLHAMFFNPVIDSLEGGYFAEVEDAQAWMDGVLTVEEFLIMVYQTLYRA